MSSRRTLSAATVPACIRAWRPQTSDWRTLKRRQLTFQNPAQLIAAAAALVPEQRPQQIGVRLVENPELVIDFGRGRQVVISLAEDEARLMAGYVLARPHVYGELIVKCDAGDESEELPVPTTGEELDEQPTGGAS